MVRGKITNPRCMRRQAEELLVRAQAVSEWPRANCYSTRWYSNHLVHAVGFVYRWLLFAKGYESDYSMRLVE